MALVLTPAAATPALTDILGACTGVIGFAGAPVTIWFSFTFRQWPRQLLPLHAGRVT